MHFRGEFTHFRGDFLHLPNPGSGYLCGFAGAKNGISF